jgi:hypothetical protein
MVREKCLSVCLFWFCGVWMCFLMLCEYHCQACKVLKDDPVLGLSFLWMNPGPKGALIFFNFKIFVVWNNTRRMFWYYTPEVALSTQQDYVNRTNLFSGHKVVISMV